jgi:hypothetical protein
VALPEAVRPAPELSGNGPRKIDQLGGVIGSEATPSTAAAQDQLYVPNDIKQKRFRRTKADVAKIRNSIIDILSEDNPQTVRQIFYALTVRGAIAKAEIEYHRTVIRRLVEMREAGQIPFEWIADNTRWMRKPSSFAGIEGMPQRHIEFLSPRSLGGDASLRRSLVRKGCSRWGVTGGDRGLRRAADDAPRQARPWCRFAEAVGDRLMSGLFGTCTSDRPRGSGNEKGVGQDLVILCWTHASAAVIRRL